MSSTIYRRQSSTGEKWGAFFIFLITIVPITLLNGWVLSVIWNWFIPVIFPALHALSVGEALGLSLVISLFTNSYLLRSKDLEGKTALSAVWYMIVTAVIEALLFLVVGFIYHLFV